MKLEPASFVYSTNASMLRQYRTVTQVIKLSGIPLVLSANTLSIYAAHGNQVSELQLQHDVRLYVNDVYL